MQAPSRRRAAASRTRGERPPGPLDLLLRRRRATAALALLAALTAALLLSWIAVPRLARRAAVARAAALGLHLHVDSARPGLGVVRFEGVTLTSPELPSAHLRLHHVEVAPSLTFGVRRVEAHGGRLTLKTDMGIVEREMQAFRARRSSGEPRRGTASALPIRVDGLDVTWQGASETAGPRAWGVRVARVESGAVELGADLVRATHPFGHLEIQGGAAKLERKGGRLRLSHVSAASLTGIVDLDGGGSEPARAPGAAPPGGSAAAATPSGASAAPPLADRIAALEEHLSGLVAEGAELSVGGIRMEVRREGQTLNVGPATATLTRAGDRVTFSLSTARAEGSTPLQVKLESRLGRDTLDAEISGGPLSLAALGVKENDMGLVDVDRAQIEARGKVRLSEDARSVTLSGHVSLTDAALHQPRLAAEPIHGIRISASGEGDLRVDGSHARLRAVQIGLGKIKVGVDGELERDGEHARGALKLGVPLAACSDLLGSVPPGLLPLLRGMQVAGTFALSADLAFDTRRPGDTRVDWDLANECRITSVPPELSPERFRGAFTRTVMGPGDVPTTIESGPGTDGWVNVFDVSPHMATAVVVCEDARFFAHGGFDEKAIQSSIRDNLKAGRFVRGGSTVTMQLAKNLYLGREKTLSRKLQEAALTLLLEQTLSKEQILELYLNVIEFAPGTYGVGPAAWHYFRTRASDLTLAQSLYLASILPNPRNHHFRPDGELSPRWAEYLRRLMHIAHKIHRIDDEDLADGLGEVLRFGMPSELPTGEPESGSAVPDVMEPSPDDARSESER